MNGFTYIWEYKATYYNTVEQNVLTRTIKVHEENEYESYLTALNTAYSENYIPGYGMLVKLELIRNDLHENYEWDNKKPENED